MLDQKEIGSSQARLSAGDARPIARPADRSDAEEARLAQADLDADRCEHCSAMGVMRVDAFDGAWLCEDCAELTYRHSSESFADTLSDWRA